MLKILTNNRLFFVLFLFWVIFGALLQIFFTPTQLIFWINEHYTNLLDWLFYYVTLLGEDTVWLCLMFGLMFEHYVRVHKKSYEMKSLLVVWLVKGLVSVSLKRVFNYPRPLQVYEYLGRQTHLVEGITIHRWQSFPSGHTITAFALAVFIAIILKQKKGAIFALIVAMLVGYSRIYLFQHFPIDVFVGSILGVGVVVLIEQTLLIHWFRQSA